jgi:predicted ester cyclase
VIRAHLEAENVGDVAATLASFARPCYEVVPMDTFADSGSVEGFLTMFFAGFPDLRQEIVLAHHAGSAVIVEMRNTGTHGGEFAGLAPTGRRIEVPSCNLFLFEGADLIRERIYFDLGTLMTQLTG